jgi:hypothetical protein
MKRLIVFMTLAVLVLGAPSGLLLLRANADSSVESVTGHAEFVTPAGIRFRYSVNAIRHKDGSVSGEFENHVDNAATGEFILRAHVGIVCFTIAGNVARIGGIIERQEGGTQQPGDEGFITVVDNGEGAEADPPDLASPPAVAPGSAFAHCEAGLFRPLFQVELGNIQVRSSGF